MAQQLHNEDLYAYLFVINTVLRTTRETKKGIQYSKQLQPIGRRYKLGLAHLEVSVRGLRAETTEGVDSRHKC